MPQLCEKLKGNGKNFQLKRKKKFISKIFFEIFWQNFFRFKFPFGFFKAKKKFRKNFKKNFDPKKLGIFFQMKIFVIFFNFFEKLGHDYQNALNFLEKKAHVFTKTNSFSMFFITFKRHTSMLDTLYIKKKISYFDFR